MRRQGNQAMALQDFSSDATLAQAALFSPSPNFPQRLRRWKSEGQNWRLHCLWGRTWDPERWPRQSAAAECPGSAAQAGKLKKASAFGLARTDWSPLLLKILSAVHLLFITYFTFLPPRLTHQLPQFVSSPLLSSRCQKTGEMEAPVKKIS